MCFHVVAAWRPCIHPLEVESVFTPGVAITDENYFLIKLFSFMLIQVYEINSICLMSSKISKAENIAACKI